MQSSKLLPSLFCQEWNLINLHIFQSKKVKENPIIPPSVHIIIYLELPVFQTSRSH